MRTANDGDVTCRLSGTSATWPLVMGDIGKRSSGLDAKRGRPGACPRRSATSGKRYRIAAIIRTAFISC